MPELDLMRFVNDMPVLVYGSLFIGILLLIEGIYRVSADSRLKSEAKVNRRLERLAAGADPNQMMQQLRRHSKERKDGIGKSFAVLHKLDRLLIQAGMTIKRSRILLVMAGLGGVVFGGLCIVVKVGILPALLLATAVGVGAPIMFIASRRKKRLKRFAEQLPEATDLIVRSLRVGHPLSSAMAVVANELTDPIASEFGVAVDEMTYGLDLQEAIDNLSDRVDVADLRYMAVAINVQYGTGGNLAEVLSGLSKVIRERFQLQRKIKAVSAEGRMSATFLTTFPFLVALGIWLLMPDYYLRVSDHPWFTVLAVLAAVLLLMNTIIMRWITNFRV
jgi:tight adherence protein B